MDDKINLDYTVKSYDSDLKKLNTLVYEMGGLVESQFVQAIEAITERDNTKAQKTILSDKRIDEKEFDIDQFAVRLLALRQPVASDLRQVVASLKISSHLERIADYAVNIAKRAVTLNQFTEVKPIEIIIHMAKIAQEMIHKVMEAYKELDNEKTTSTWKQDTEIDKIYASVLQEMTSYMTKNPSAIVPCTHILFMAKNIERIGDHVTNIAEAIHFITHGKPFNEPRPKIEEIDLSILETLPH